MGAQFQMGLNEARRKDTNLTLTTAASLVHTQIKWLGGAGGKKQSDFSRLVKQWVK